MLMSEIVRTDARMLLHICCAPCAGVPSRMLLEEGFELFGFWHAPNIHPMEEWEHRRESVERLALLCGMPMFWSEDFRQQEWQERFARDAAAQHQGTANARCGYCHALRMEATAKLAAEQGIPLFTTSLTISPYQNHEAIREAGERAAARHGVAFVYRDFRPWYREGINLARAEGWYIQKYCGCLFSHAASDHPKKPAYTYT
jgi:predicted adenine nucleotide alpha hydrolase (AANH) superfamily ATPase